MEDSPQGAPFDSLVSDAAQSPPASSQSHLSTSDVGEHEQHLARTRGNAYWHATPSTWSLSPLKRANRTRDTLGAGEKDEDETRRDLADASNHDQLLILSSVPLAPDSSLSVQLPAGPAVEAANVCPAHDWDEEDLPSKVPPPQKPRPTSSSLPPSSRATLSPPPSPIHAPSPSASSSSLDDLLSPRAQLAPLPRLSPSPPRALRKRTAAQLAPYSIESHLYTRSLLATGWKGAVVPNPVPAAADRLTHRPRKERRWDDLNGWLDVQPEHGVAFRAASDSEASTESTEESVDGEDLLEREARKARREIQTQKKRKRKDGIRRQPSQEGSREVGTFRRKAGRTRWEPKQQADFVFNDDDLSDGQDGADYDHRRNAIAGPSAISLHHGGGSKRALEHGKPAPSSKSGPRSNASEDPSHLPPSNTHYASSNARPPFSGTSERRKMNSREPRHQRGFGLESDDSAILSRGPSKVVAKLRPAGAFWGRRRAVNGAGELDRALLGIELPPERHKEILVISDDAEDDDEAGFDVVDEDSGGERALPPINIQLSKKKLRALKSMMPRAYFKTALEDLELMKAEQAAGYLSGSDRGSGDEEYVAPKSAHGKGSEGAPVSVPRPPQRRKVESKTIALDTIEAIFDFAAVAAVLDEYPEDIDPDQPSARLRTPLIPLRPNDADSVSVTRTSTSAGPVGYWASFTRFSPDFSLGRLPTGARFPPTSFVGLGHLSNLLHPILPVASGNATFVFGNLLDSTMDVDALKEFLPLIADGIFESITRDTEVPETDPGQLATGPSEALRFLGHFITEGLARIPEGSRRPFAAYLAAQLDRLDTQLDDFEQRHPILCSAVNRHRITLSWYFVDLTVRLGVTPDVDRDDARLSRLTSTLVSRLVKHGAADAIRALRALDGDERVVCDISVEAWLALISLALCPAATHGAFIEADLWRIVDEQTQASVPSSMASTPVAGEVPSCTAMLLCAISQFSATGISSATPRLHAHWNILSHAFDLFPIEALSKPMEHGMSNTSLARLDRYLRTVFERCFILVERWNWRFQADDKVLTKMYAVLMTRNLANLSFETSEDFPLFLQHFEQFGSVKFDPATDTAFTIFVKLVMQASQDVTSAAGADKTRILSRLLARLTPMTQKPWTKAFPELMRNPSPLVNHYSLLITFAALHPVSAGQRLDQARRLLDFANVGQAERKICIRAILNFGVVFRKERLSVDPIVEWMSSITGRLRGEYVDIEARERKAGKSAEALYNVGGPLWRHSVLLVSLLRTAEYLLKADDEYPEAILLHPAWTTQLLASPIWMDQTVCQAVVNLIARFLDLREATLPPKAPNASKESQDEYGLLDMDLDDPSLNELLQAVDAGSVAPVEAGYRVQDAMFAQNHAGVLAPLLHQLLNVVLSNKSPRAVSSQDQSAYERSVMTCWSRCLCVLLDNGCITLEPYLKYGANSWRRINDPVGRREAGLFLAVHVLEHNAELVEGFQADFLEIWFQSAVARKLTLQHTLTAILINSKSISPLLDDLPFDRSGEAAPFDVSLALFRERRLAALEAVFRNIAHVSLLPPPSRWTRPAILNLLRPMVAAMLDNLAAAVKETSRAAYAVFVRAVLKGLKACGGIANEQSLAQLRPLTLAVALK